MASKKNISRERDIWKDQNRNWISTTATFCIMKRTARPARTRMSNNLIFIESSSLGDKRNAIMSLTNYYTDLSGLYCMPRKSV